MSQFCGCQVKDTKVLRKLVINRIYRRFSTLKSHQGFRRYAINTTWMMAEQLLRIIAGLFVGIWIARYLGPEQFGVFSYVVAFSAIFTGIAKLGLDAIVVRELVNRPELRDVYLGTAFWLKVLGALLAITLISFILPLTSNDAKTNLFIFIVSTGFVFQSFEVVEFYFQSQVMAKIVSICKSVQLALSSIIKIYLVLIQAELLWFVIATALDAVCLGISYLMAYRIKNNTSFYKHFDAEVSKKLLKDSWPLILSSLVVMVYVRIDQVMIKEMLGDYEVGIYSAAVRLSEAFYFLPVLVSASLFPAIINAKKQGLNIYLSRMQRLYTFMIWSAVLIALPTTFLSAWLINLLFGSDYTGADRVLIIHIWASVFVFLAVSSGKYLTNEGKTKKVFARNLIGMVVNIALNFILIPRNGIEGAAVATLISWTISGYIYDFIDKDQYVMACQKTKGFFGVFK